MFVTMTNGLVKWLSPEAGQALIDSGDAVVSDLVQAAICVSRAVYLGNSHMHEMQRDLEECYLHIPYKKASA